MFSILFFILSTLLIFFILIIIFVIFVLMFIYQFNLFLIFLLSYLSILVSSIVLLLFISSILLSLISSDSHPRSFGTSNSIIHSISVSLPATTSPIGNHLLLILWTFDYALLMSHAALFLSISTLHYHEIHYAYGLKANLMQVAVDSHCSSSSFLFPEVTILSKYFTNKLINYI